MDAGGRSADVRWKVARMVRVTRILKAATGVSNERGVE